MSPRLCKPTATSLFTSCSSSGSISMTRPLSRTPSRRAQRRSYADSLSELLVAVMRQSGTRALVKVADAIGISSSRPRFNNLGYFLTGLAASGMLFSICILTVALVFALLADPIARLFGKPLDQSLWPNDLDNVGSELWTIVPPILVCLMMAVSLLGPNEAT